MKPILYASIVAAMLITSGCVSRRTTVIEQPTPVVTTVAPASGTRMVTVLPTGYGTKVYRGVTYYTYRDVYYRSVPGGYEVVTRPW